MGRGPSYPYVGLEDAVMLARKMYDYTKRAPAPLESIVSEAWEYSASSSSGQKVLAALRAFELVEDAANGKNKTLKLTQRAIQILLGEEDSSERQEELRSAALSPKWYEYCWRTWGKEMPPSMRSNLLVHHGFVDTTVDGFLKDYRETVAFAGLLDDRNLGKKEGGTEDSKFVAQVGDYVQWESQGTLRMPAAQKLTHFSPDRAFAFVEGSPTGIPIGELIAAEAPEPEPLSPTNPPAKKDAPVVHGGKPMLQETFSLPDGTSVSIQWPASFTPEAFEDFSDWLNIVKRKIGRTVKQSEEERGLSEEERMEMAHGD